MTNPAWAMLSACLMAGCATTAMIDKPCDAPFPAEVRTSIEERLAEFDGCFVLRDMSGRRTLRVNAGRCAERLSPCSTFKIFNALTALDCGVVADADAGFQWDGVERSIESWNRDHTLGSAVEHSVVWCFQQIARDIGEQRMGSALHAVGYGNEDTSSGIDRFWLHPGSLVISADEQAAFLARLYRDELPFDRRAMDITRRILVLERGDGFILSGKTGSAWIDGQWTMGWFVGCIQRGEEEYIFAMNLMPRIEGQRVNGWLAREVTRATLVDAGLMPE